MREFKFRVWDLEKKFYLNQDDEFHFYEPDRGWQCPIPLCECLRDKKRYVVQQYTGSTDKNKNLIYEGDIVKYNPDKPNIERIGIIEFSNYYKGWSIKDSHCYPLSDFGVYSLGSPFLSFNWTEIVGNIFEHAELLK
jgi:uncharacterized phage protein (TIGR01671 family)